jgi:hypothetical protein
VRAGPSLFEVGITGSALMCSRLSSYGRVGPIPITPGPPDATPANFHRILLQMAFLPSRTYGSGPGRRARGPLNCQR